MVAGRSRVPFFFKFCDGDIEVVELCREAAEDIGVRSDLCRVSRGTYPFVSVGSSLGSALQYLNVDVG